MAGEGAAPGGRGGDRGLRLLADEGLFDRDIAGPRQRGTFWPIYFMLVYTVVGLWVGLAFVAIGLSIIALTLVGYFFIGDAFDLWMAFVNGGGLILGGLWMRRS